MQTNFLIIGSGISGLNFALHAAKKGRVLLITKKNLIDSNTNYAQGGIAAILDKNDNPQDLIHDTLAAGAYHNKKKPWNSWCIIPPKPSTDS